MSDSPKRPTHLNAWISQPSPFIIEAAAKAGYDSVTLDMQHGFFDVREVARAAQLLDILGVPSYVRLSINELSLVPRLLDFGLTGAVLATVDDVESATRAVSQARYQPDGMRSYGGQRYGLRPEPIPVRSVRPEVWVMIETSGGIKNLEALAHVPGIAGFNIGPADLSLAMGLEVSKRAESAAWEQQIMRILRVANEAGIEAWTFGLDGTDAARWAAEGFHRVTVGSDIALLRSAMAREIGKARGQAAAALAVDI